MRTCQLLAFFYWRMEKQKVVRQLILFFAIVITAPASFAQTTFNVTVKDEVTKEAIDHPLRRRRSVLRLDRQQHEQAGPDTADDLASHLDPGLGDSLQQRDHLSYVSP